MDVAVTAGSGCDQPLDLRFEVVDGESHMEVEGVNGGLVGDVSFGVAVELEHRTRTVA